MKKIKLFCGGKFHFDYLNDNYLEVIEYNREISKVNFYDNTSNYKSVISNRFFAAGFICIIFPFILNAKIPSFI